MFDMLKRHLNLVAPVSGKVIDLALVPDMVFARKLAGDGAAIDSTSEIIVAPADGTLSMIFRTNHAFGITMDNGLELLVHIGIDTVELNGEGFERIAEEGCRIKAGDPVIRIDRDFICSKGYSLITPLLVTNMDMVKSLKSFTDKIVDAGKDVAITCAMK